MNRKNRFFFGITGALFFWCIKGFRGDFNDELNNNYVRNLVATIIIWILIYYFILK